ncbi:MAG: hypothetical protein JJE17_07400, partial [Peptostreptococcaceae bacterium]|nr:hypothetical protein [Peptostreptococcaceae bacterium]
AFAMYKLHADTSISTSPGSLRGNKVYAFRQQPKIESIGTQLDAMHQTSYDNGILKSNEIFCTFTHSYDYSFEGLANSWDEVRKHWTKIIRVAKKSGVIEYVKTSESHLKGGCHLHAVFVLNKTWDFYPVNEGVYKKTGIEKITYRNDELTQLFENIWGTDFGFIDLQGARNKEASTYIIKELGKYSEVESALSFYGKEKSCNEDYKRIMTYYMAIKYGAHLISTSRGIKYVPSKEGESIETGSDLKFSDLAENRAKALKILAPDNRENLVKAHMNITTDAKDSAVISPTLMSVRVNKSEYSLVFKGYRPDGFCKKTIVGSLEWSNICDYMYSVLSDPLYVAKELFNNLRKNKIEETPQINNEDFGLFRVSVLVPSSDGELIWSIVDKFDEKLKSVLFFEKYLTDIVKTFEGFRIETGEDSIIREWIK